MATWTAPQAPQEPLRLHPKQRAAGDQEAKALACYGVLLKHNATTAQNATAQNATAQNAGAKEDNGSQMLLRFVQGRPVSSVTCQFLQWVCQRLQDQGQRVLVLVWDNATWHLSRQVQQWIGTYNQQAKQTGGLRLDYACWCAACPARVPGSMLLSQSGGMASKPWWSRSECSVRLSWQSQSVLTMTVSIWLILNTNSMVYALTSQFHVRFVAL